MDMEGQKFNASLRAATIRDADLPGLLGLDSLRRNRCVVDFTTLKLYFCGPDDTNLDKHMPAGTKVFQCEISPSGHLALPCCNYNMTPKKTDEELALLQMEDLVAPYGKEWRPPAATRSSPTS